MQIQASPMNDDEHGNNEKSGSTASDFLNFFDASFHLENQDILYIKRESVTSNRSNGQNDQYKNCSIKSNEEKNECQSNNIINTDSGKKT